MGKTKESQTAGLILGSPKRSLLPRGLRQKLMVAFSLMSVLPLMVLGYVLVNFVFPHTQSLGEFSWVTGITLVLGLLGFFVMRALVLPVIQMASQVQEIAAGHLERSVSTRAPDELGALGVALNQVTRRVRENMAQLRVYGEQTKHLNVEINRRILVLSHLLQVSNLISQSAKIEEVIAFVLEKLTHLEEAELNCLLEPSGEPNTFLVRAAAGIDPQNLKLPLTSRWIAPWLAQALVAGKTLVVDAKSGASREREALQQFLGMANGVCQPLTSRGFGMGALLCANGKADFTFGEESLELLKVFAKQLTIAIENDLLIKRAEELKVLDELTGLYNAGYTKSRLEEEIRRARRYHRACSVVLLNLDDFRKLRELYGGLTAESVLKQMATLLREGVTEVDRIGRTGPDEFMMILPERNKREAIELAENIRRRIEEHSFVNGSQRIPKPLTVSGGVSENPLDGSTGEELVKKASEAVRSAKAQGKNRIMPNATGSRLPVSL